MVFQIGQSYTSQFIFLLNWNIMGQCMTEPPKIMRDYWSLRSVCTHVQSNSRHGFCWTYSLRWMVSSVVIQSFIKTGWMPKLISICKFLLEAYAGFVMIWWFKMLSQKMHVKSLSTVMLQANQHDYLVLFLILAWPSRLSWTLGSTWTVLVFPPFQMYICWHDWSCSVTLIIAL